MHLAEAEFWEHLRERGKAIFQILEVYLLALLNEGAIIFTASLN